MTRQHPDHPAGGSELTWTCHVCGRERPDALISVYSTTRTTRHGIEIRQNVRYCNDTLSCARGARDVCFIGGRDDGTS